MKTGKSLSELAMEIDRQQKSKQDFIADTRTLELLASAGAAAPLMLSFNSTNLPLRQHAHNQIGERAGIPAKYYDRMAQDAPELLAHNVNHWFKQRPENRMVRVLDGHVRAFLSDRFARIDNFDVASVAIPILQEAGGLIIRSCEITDSRLYIKATSTNVVAEVKGSKRVGDLVEAGIMISNSEVGLGALSVKPFYNFLVCTNGMVRDSIMRSAHIGRKQDASDAMLSDQTKKAEDTVVLMKLRDVLKTAMDAAAFQAAIDLMSDQTRQFIKGDPVKAIQVLANASVMSQDERSSVLRNLIQGGDLSRFGLMNAITRTAEDVVSYDRATELEAMGGRLLDLPANDWRMIAEAA